MKDGITVTWRARAKSKQLPDAAARASSLRGWARPVTDSLPRPRLAVPLSLALLAVTACATTPVPPSADMVRAEAAIAQAQKAGAGDLANDPLQAAQRKLGEAKTAAAQGDAMRTGNLVDESMADAQLADLTAQSVTSSRAAVEVDKSITASRSEADRRSAP